MPVVVIVNVSQEPLSWATIVWDNAFSEINRIPFAVVDEVPWSKMAETLNMKFHSLTGRGLTEENLSFLCKWYRLHLRNILKCILRNIFNIWISDEKISGGITIYNPELSISRSQFCKDTLPFRQFSFWDWFYSFMKLARDDLRGTWVEGLIVGFVRKDKAEALLSNCQSGTFLLRFSDSILGLLYQF